jgi:hypothetical protein
MHGLAQLLLHAPALGDLRTQRTIRLGDLARLAMQLGEDGDLGAEDGGVDRTNR